MTSRAARLALLAAASLLGGCSSCRTDEDVPDGSSSFDGGDNGCAPPCDSGMTCRSGACVPESEDGGAPDGASDDGGLDGNDVPGDGGCASTSSKAEKLPLDMYIMLDQSYSMNDQVGTTTKWSAVTSALKDFLAQADMVGVSVGLQYFGLPDTGMCSTTLTCTQDSDCNGCGPCRLFGDGLKCLATTPEHKTSCNSSDYENPAVEIAPFSEVAPRISSSIAQIDRPINSTPTSAALQGAIDHARAWKAGHPKNMVAVVLATDGDPYTCDVNLANIKAIAASGAEDGIRTFVIGVGKSLTSLNGIATSGGTDSAIMVDTSGNVTDQFREALNRIRGEAIRCSYAIPAPPPPEQLDYKRVFVTFSPGDGANLELFEKVPSKEACGAQQKAWHYDDESNPRQIILCPETCTRVESVTSGEIDIVLGCRPIIPT